MEHEISALQLSHPGGRIGRIVHDGYDIPLSVFKRSAMADIAATATSTSDWPCGTAEACVIQNTPGIDDNGLVADSGSCQGNMLGVCIGVGIGAPLLLGLAIFIFLHIRRRNRRSARNPPIAPQLETPPRGI